MSFLWLFLNDKLLTNKTKFERHMTNSNICPRCGRNFEIALHDIRDCPMISNTWLRLVSPSLWSKFFNGGLEQWFE